MSESSLIRRLGIKAGHRLLIVNAPAGYLEALGPLPPNVSAETEARGMYDVVQVFVHHRADIDARAPAAIQAVKPGGLLWFAYPKKSSGVKTDITRDVGWETVRSAGWEGIAQVAVDETWSATRFRPTGDIKRRGSARR